MFAIDQHGGIHRDSVNIFSSGHLQWRTNGELKILTVYLLKRTTSAIEPESCCPGAAFKDDRGKNLTALFVILHVPRR